MKLVRSKVHAVFQMEEYGRYYHLGNLDMDNMGG
jgi:hypothetical protein